MSNKGEKIKKILSVDYGYKNKEVAAFIQKDQVG